MSRAQPAPFTCYTSTHQYQSVLQVLAWGCSGLLSKSAQGTIIGIPIRTQGHGIEGVNAQVGKLTPEVLGTLANLQYFKNTYR